MKILAVSDEPARALRETCEPEKWRGKGIELIVSCGDLSVEYLEYISDLIQVPLFYVRGNHDDAWRSTPGGEDIHGRIVTLRGVRFLGLEGAPRFNDKPYQYTEAEVVRRLMLLGPRLWLSRGVDVVVTHAAPQFCPYAYELCGKPVGVGRDCTYLPRQPDGRLVCCPEAEDMAHRGFAAYRDLILRYKPKLLIHGHRHRTFGRGKQEQTIGETRVVDALGYVILDV
jgi:Icc-related predicted phosphoesterase